MEEFRSGQRWISETEPELGLGVLESVSRHRIEIVFPAANETRYYARENAPVKRVRFRAGDTIEAEDGKRVLVEEVAEDDGLLTYVGGGEKVPEADLADSISFSKPEDRLIGGRADSSTAFALRYEALERRGRMLQSEIAGFAGGRIDLIPHQLYIASEVSARHQPRVLLADEVGLGKTIEACLILHRLHLTGRAGRVLLVLPESLTYQWFLELWRRFNLWFVLLDEEYCRSLTEVDTEANPFLENQLVICSLGMLLENERWARCAMEADWGMLVVDEAHHLAWAPGAPSPEYSLVEGLARRSEGVLLLTATPEQLGTEGHFARLRLLDPDRYPDLEKFRAEQESYAGVAELADKLVARKKLTGEEERFLREMFTELDGEAFAARLRDPDWMVEELVDRHGTGRVIFRNTREALRGFPKRKAHPVALEPRKTLSREALNERFLREFEFEAGAGESAEIPYDFRHGPRITWLADFLRTAAAGEKVLLICRRREKAEAIQEALAEEINAKAAVFHEKLTLLQRDRNAAWFSDPEGAQILICSEIGSEGRNFQFAHHLVLFDLPFDPELLEQRIGRLDRIGQTATIQIHVPFLKDSWTELLMRWHHEGLDGIEHSLKGGNAYLEKFGDELYRQSRIYHEADPSARREADALIDQTRRFRDDLETRLEEGQDRLIALHSFREKEAEHLVDQIRKEDESRALDAFMNRIFDHFGVTVEEIGERTFHLSAEHLFTDSFPSLPEEGTTVTCDRRRALSREDIGFLTWDHPMVRGAIDLILSSEQGNSSIVVWKKEKAEAPPVLMEVVYVLESVAPPHLHVDRFLPPTPVRVLVDSGGANHSASFSRRTIENETRDEEVFRIQGNPELLRALVPSMLRSAEEHAARRKSELLEKAMGEAHAHLDGEAARLKELAKVNPNVRRDEIRSAEKMIEDVVRPIAKAHLRLDAVRLILKDPNGGEANGS